MTGCDHRSNLINSSRADEDDLCRHHGCPVARSAAITPIGVGSIQALRQSLSAYGGVSTADEVIQQLRLKYEQPISILARWIVDREVLSFTHLGETLIPKFQLDWTQMVVRSEVASVLRELLGHADEWQIGAWFAEPNGYLDGKAPIQALYARQDGRCTEIYQAARAWRFAIHG